MNKQTKAIPKFANEAQERAYWESHDSTEHLDWSKARKVTLPNLKPTISLEGAYGQFPIGRAAGPCSPKVFRAPLLPNHRPPSPTSAYGAQ